MAVSLRGDQSHNPPKLKAAGIDALAQSSIDDDDNNVLVKLPRPLLQEEFLDRLEYHTSDIRDIVPHYLSLSKTQKGEISASMAKAVELSKIAEDLVNLQQTFSRSDSVFLDTPRRKVFRLENIVLKFGLDVNPVEAETLRYIAKATNVPVPRLYRDHIHSDGTAVIAMEYVEGRILSDLWPSLCHDIKTNICGQLRNILKEMRCHQSNIIGGIHGNPAVDTRKFVLTGGPFQTERQFNEFLRSDLISGAPKIHRSMLEEVMDENHDIVLAHGDISPQNIVINNDQIVAILDWECSGWYPEYWDFVKFFNALDPSLDWFDYAEEIFPKIYPRQFLNDNFLGRYLSH